MSCFGCCAFCRYMNYDVEERELYERSRYIEKQLSKERRQLRQEVKLLLLGAGESGKSTFVKQMKIIHGYNFDPDHLMEYRQTIYSNIVKGMRVLISARNAFEIEWENPENALFADHVYSYDSQPLDPKLFSEYVDQIHFLWEDAAIRRAYERRAEFQISDGVRYFFENLDRISYPDYMPTCQDILHARKATKGITEYSVEVNSVPFTFVDVGGQRSQRHKWFQCFDTVTSILFMVSSSEYDQRLLEERKTNRLEEARAIFENIVNHRAFTDVSMILFLNKTDLLKEKLQKLVEARSQGARLSNGGGENLNGITASNNTTTTTDNLTTIQTKQIEIRITNPDEQTKVWRGSAEPPTTTTTTISTTTSQPEEMKKNEEPVIRLQTIKDFFPEFTRDPLNLNDVQQFILDMFDRTRRDRRKMMYHHFTTAVDTENIKYVFNAVRSTILHKNITALMLQ